MTFLGQIGTAKLMQHLERRSVIIGCMASFMLLSTGVMMGEAVVRILAAIKDESLWELGSICS